MKWFIIFDNNILYVDKKYEFYKCTFISKLHQILFHNNIVIFDYNMYNFKIYLKLKLWSI